MAEPTQPYSLQTPPCFFVEHWYVGVALVALAIIGGFVATYYCNESFHQLIDHTFTQIHLSTQEALLYIAVPIVGTSFVIGVSAHAYRKHQFKKDHHLQLYDIINEPEPIWVTLKEMLPTQQTLKITGIVLVILAFMAAAGYGIAQIPDVDQWLQQDAIPFIKNILDHKFALWEALSYIGGTTLGISILIAVPFGIIQTLEEKQKEADLDKIYNDLISDSEPDYNVNY